MSNPHWSIIKANEEPEVFVVTDWRQEIRGQFLSFAAARDYAWEHGAEWVEEPAPATRRYCGACSQEDHDACTSGCSCCV